MLSKPLAGFKSKLSNSHVEPPHHRPPCIRSCAVGPNLSCPPIVVHPLIFFSAPKGERLPSYWAKMSCSGLTYHLVMYLAEGCCQYTNVSAMMVRSARKREFEAIIIRLETTHSNSACESSQFGSGNTYLERVYTSSGCFGSNRGALSGRI